MIVSWGADNEAGYTPVHAKTAGDGAAATGSSVNDSTVQANDAPAAAGKQTMVMTVPDANVQKCVRSRPAAARFFAVFFTS